jgi:hypothetical protein
MITSSGFSAPAYEGITLSPVIQRYQLQTRLFSSLNTPSSSTPTEVIFTDFIPDSLAISAHLSISSACKEINEKTHLTVRLTAPVNLGQGGKVHVLRLEFPSSGAWASNLGMPANTLEEKYPCIGIAGGSWVTSMRCDIYTFSSGSFVQAPASGVPWIDIYSFGELVAGAVLTVHIPDILHSGSTGAIESINAFLLEETIGHSPSFITLYSGTISISTLASRSFSSYTARSSSDLSLSPNTPTPNLSPSYTYTWDTGAASPAVTRYYFDSSLPDVGTALLSCGASTCLQFGKPVQGMVVVHSSASQTVAATTPAGVIQHPAYTYSIPFYLEALKADSTFSAKVSYSYPIAPGSVASPAFREDLDANPLLFETAGLSDIYKAEFSFQNPVPAGGRIVLSLTGMSFDSTANYCSYEGLAPSSYAPVVCSYSSTSSLLLTSFGTIAASTTVRVSFRLKSSSAGSFNPTLAITSYYDSDNSRRIDYVASVDLQERPVVVSGQTQLSSLDLVASTDPIRAGYHGPLKFSISPRTSPTIDRIEVTLTNDFSTEGNALGLPLRCDLNGERGADCTYSLSPLTITALTSVNSGAGLLSTNTLEVSTETSDWGFSYPSSPGRYLVSVRLLLSAVVKEQSTHYITILPEQLYYFQVEAMHTDSSLANTYTMRFALSSSQSVPAYSAGGRLTFFFPLTDVGGTAFTAALGAYSDGQEIDCSTNMSSPTTVKCRILVSPIGQASAVEVQNFNALLGDVYYELLLFGIRSPSSTLEDILFTMKV